MAHFLMLEHHLSTTTLIKEVKRAEPAILAVIEPSRDTDRPDITITRTLPLSFDLTDPEPDEDKSTEKCCGSVSQFNTQQV